MAYSSSFDSCEGGFRPAALIQDSAKQQAAAETAWRRSSFLQHNWDYRRRTDLSVAAQNSVLQEEADQVGIYLRVGREFSGISRKKAEASPSISLYRM